MGSATTVPPGSWSGACTEGFPRNLGGPVASAWRPGRSGGRGTAERRKQRRSRGEPGRRGVRAPRSSRRSGGTVPRDPVEGRELPGHEELTEGKMKRDPAHHEHGHELFDPDSERPAEAGAGDDVHVLLAPHRHRSAARGISSHAQGQHGGVAGQTADTSTPAHLEDNLPMLLSTALEVRLRLARRRCGAVRHPEGRPGRNRGPSASRLSGIRSCSVRSRWCWRPSTSRTSSDCSYGFRPGRSAHRALEVLQRRRRCAWRAVGSWRSTLAAGSWSLNLFAGQDSSPADRRNGSTEIVSSRQFRLESEQAVARSADWARFRRFAATATRADGPRPARYFHGTSNEVTMSTEAVR